MKRGAACPSCQSRVSRLKSAAIKPFRCRRCGVMIKSQGRFWSNALAGGMLVLFFLTWIAHRFLDWIGPWAFWTVGGVYIVGFWIALPYAVWFRQTSHGPVCVKCGYELRGCAGPDCPECGTRIDVPIGRGDDATET